jgi:hypothetical protein
MTPNTPSSDTAGNRDKQVELFVQGRRSVRLPTGAQALRRCKESRDIADSSAIEKAPEGELCTKHYMQM